mgnify:FL=1
MTAGRPVQCREAGWNAKRGFVDFVLSIGEGFDEDAARQLWKLPLDAVLAG